jgi:hypothetical protein
VDLSELLQHNDMVVVMENILSRASPKHQAREEDKLARGEDANQRAYERRRLE